MQQMEFPGAGQAVCWCGGFPSQPFAPEYGRCPQCGTLVYTGPRPAQLEEVASDEQGFYGEAYWYERQTQTHGLSDLPARAREDLRQKCPAWLRSLLNWRLPPARVLELGAAHGAFVAVMRWAGYDAAGLELSPAVTAWAREHFQVPMFLGTLDRQGLVAASYDAVCLFDVLEHVSDPLGLLRECRRVLKPGGLLLLQTPETPAGRTRAELEQADHPFLRMLIPVEHLHLFTREGLREALRRAGFAWSEPETALSPEFNMSAVASDAALVKNTAEEIRAALLATPGGRLVEALLDLESEYTVADRDRRDRMEIIQRADAEMAEVQRALDEAGRKHRQAEERLRAKDRNWLVNVARRVARHVPALPASNGEEARELRYLCRIAVDLTPMLPGGENGGAKTMALEQLRNLALLRPETEFLVLSKERTRAELEQFRLRMKNVRVEVTDPPAQGFARRAEEWSGAVLRGGAWLGPTAAIDLLYCPFTAPFFHRPGLACVCFVHDLQFADYPQFFPQEVQRERRRDALAAVKRASLLVCGTEFVKASLVKHLNAPAEKIRVVPHVVPHRVPSQRREVLRRLLDGREQEGFLFYPANFWPHKNHAMLLTAFGMYRREGGRLRLVLTGAPGPAADQMQAAVDRMGLSGEVKLAGFLPDDDFGVLFAAARALVFPSLYEGFGMPLLEAMRLHVPVMAANASCLPEVAGDAAIYFDPRRPDEMAAQMHRIDSDSELRATLLVRGAERVGTFGGPATSTLRLLALFDEALAAKPEYHQLLEGLYEDGWSADKLLVGWRPMDAPGVLELEIEAPTWLPHETVQIRAPDGAPVALRRGERKTLEYPLDARGGWAEFLIWPVFRPSDVEGSGDTRWLGVRLNACRLRAGGGVRDLIAMEETHA